MVALSGLQKAQVRFHLSYTAATPAAERARLEKAMNEVPDSYTASQIAILIGRCETAFEKSQLTTGDLSDEEQTAVTGDTTRTTTLKIRASWNRRQRYLQNEQRQLARALGVINYSDPEKARTIIGDGIYISSVPGETGATGSVSAAAGLILNWSNAPTTGNNQTAIFVDITDGILKKRSPNNGTITSL